MNTILKSYLKVVLGVALAALILLILWYFKTIVSYILIAAVLAVVGKPLVRFFASFSIRGHQVSQSFAAFVTLVIIWIAIATFGSLFVPLVFHKMHQLAYLDFDAVTAGIQEPIANVEEFLSSFFAAKNSDFSLVESIKSTLMQEVDAAAINHLFSSIVSVAFSAVIAVLSISFITFFFLRDEGLFYSMVASMFPSKYGANITRALDSITLLLSRYFSGLLSESLVLMFTVSLSMMLFGMNASDAFFIGLIMAVMNVVPYAGPFIGGLMATFVGIVTPIEGMTAGQTALIIICVLLVLKGLDDFVLQPTLYSERVKAHPLEIFIVILIAASLAGIVGMLLAIPSYTVIRVFAKEFFSQFSLVRKLTEKI